MSDWAKFGPGTRTLPQKPRAQKMMRFRTWLAVGLIAILSTPVDAQDGRGSETNLPLPRFVSLKRDEARARRGPSFSYRIDWVYQRRHLPLQVTAEYGHWRRVRDRDGAGGWVHYSLLRGQRTVIVERDLLSLHRRPSPEATIIARLEMGVVADLGKCIPEWCHISTEGYKGWVVKSALWGVLSDEIRN